MAEYSKFRRLFVFKITGLCEQSAQTTLNQLQWSELAMYSGVKLALASRGELGKRLDYKLTLRIQEPSFGAGIKARSMLLSMNFVEASMSVTCFDGWTVTQSSWKLRDLPQC